MRSAPFRASRRCQEFLRFVVSKSLIGETEFLKERIIGAEVFGRDSSYETSEDAIVRVKANEVRKRLAQYYMDAGANDPIRIEMVPGSYVAEFRQMAPTVAEPQIIPIPVEPPAPEQKPRSRKWAALVLIPIAAVCFLLLRKPALDSLDQFWDPIAMSPSSTMVCTGNSLSYTLSPRVQLEFLRKHPERLNSVSLPIPITPEMHLQPEDIIPVSGDQVSVGTFYSALDISSLLQRKGKPVLVRAGCELVTDDLSEHSFILLGSFSNPWTMELSKGLRFTFQRDLTDEGVVSQIVDREAKQPGTWKLSNAFAYGPANHDYALVTRVIHAENKQVMVSAAGLTRYGTQIAGEFITNALYWNEAMKSAPKGWETKNLQIVLETDVVGKTPNTPHVLAMHFW